MASSRTVLGVLGRGPAHGYEIKRTHDAALPGAKPLAFGQVYATLTRLMRDGLVEVVEVSRGGGPERNVYALTESGRQNLRDWLAAPVEPAPYVESEVVEKSLLALHLGEGARGYLRRQRTAHLARMRELVATKPASMEERLAVDFAIAHLDADLRWIEDTTARLAERAGGGKVPSMTPDIDEDPASQVPSDAELLARVRGGDVHAYGELFDRHRDAAYRLANRLARDHDHDSDDLVSEAFAKVLSDVKSGRGPDVFFRAYLLQAIRHVHVDRINADRRLQLTDEGEQWESPVPFQDSAVEEFERSAAARAFASLPDRWQFVLRQVDIEGKDPDEIGELLGLSANGVSALAYRAREGLRTAHLRMHLADTASDTCRWTIEYLGAYVRSGLSPRDAGKVKDHLVHCPRCAGLYEELTEVHEMLDDADGNTADR